MITHHELCFGCGQANLFGLQLEMTPGADGRSAAGRFFVKQDHQGPPGICHGGILATALDEAMSLLIHHLGIHALTVGLDIRLKGPAPVGTFVNLTARLGESDERRVVVTAAATSGDDPREIALGTGTFVLVER